MGVYEMDRSKAKLLATKLANVYAPYYKNSDLTDVEETSGILVPSVFNLSQNYPNPFNPRTTIRFQLPERAMVILKVYDLLGSEVTSLLSQEIGAGDHRVEWNAANVASGMYFYELTSGGSRAVKKMVVLK
jgi:hypothetical protein